MRNVILADNQAITKAGLRYLLIELPTSVCPVEAENKQVLIGALVAMPNAVVVLDYTLFDLAGVEELLILHERFYQVDWILFSEELSDTFLRRLVYNTDVFSVVMKECPLSEIKAALQSAQQSERYICQRVVQLLGHRFKEVEKEIHALTATERDILKLIALGKTTKEIASDRFSSVHTIITHRKNIFRKLEVNNVHEATKYAMRAGIVDLSEYYI